MARLDTIGRSYRLTATLAACLSIVGCTGSTKPEGERLARARCASCHEFPEPQLLDRKTWQDGVLPQMALRLRVPKEKSSFLEGPSNPYMMVLTDSTSTEDWQKIVGYYLTHAPESLPPQSLPAEPQIDPVFFTPVPLVPRLQSSGIITLLKTDSLHQRLFVGEAGSNTLRIFDWNRRLLSTLKLDSPPTALIAEPDRVLVLESGILSPNDRPRGRLVQYDFAGGDSLRFGRVLIDSLFRPVFVEPFDFDKDGVNELVICEFGDNRGRLALYRFDGSRYQRQILDGGPGAIRVEIRDMTGDGSPDIVALFAQADERIVLFENDGKGRFTKEERILLRFPPVYGSMYFTLRDFNKDGQPDILYVNGDNFDYSRVPKPYHGIRIFENDGKNGFHERYFFPVYGAAQSVVADFDNDGDLDIMTASNF
ncbi:MAG: VCBS repeat-containing protein, partial [Gemmatimonadota bacterium]|nr:VCBS repeat-containing protein [Gemmatimonadota bacterium]